MKNSITKLFEIKVAGTLSLYGDCTITKQKNENPSIIIQIDDEFLQEINPQKIPLYITTDGTYTYIPYNGEVKFDAARKYVKMWTAITIFAIQKGINPKNLFSMVLHCNKHKDIAPEIALRKWEKDNNKIEFPKILELIERAQNSSPEDKVHNWIREKTKMYISVQKPESY